MSFSNNVKMEICEIYKLPESCKASLLYGFLLTAKKFDAQEIEVFSESKEVATYINELVLKLYSFNMQVECLSGYEGQKKTLYRIHSSEKALCREICYSFNCGKFSEYVSLFSSDETVTWAFIKGIFLGCGSVSDPKTVYHLEFSLKEKRNALFVQNMLASLSLMPKMTERRGYWVVYFKDSSEIEDVLTGIGAVKMVLSFMDTKVIKDLRNRINRRNNCETANMKRTINISTEQVDAIEHILNSRGTEFLSDDLKKIADFRVKNPEMSLNEFEKAMNGEFSKSGISRRLKKLIEISRDIK